MSNKHSLRPQGGAGRRSKYDHVESTPEEGRQMEPLGWSKTENDASIRHKDADKFHRENNSYKTIRSDGGVKHTTEISVEPPRENLDVAGDVENANEYHKSTQLAKMHKEVKIYSPANMFAPASKAVVMFLRFHFFLIIFLFVTALLAIPALKTYYNSDPLARAASISGCFAADRNRTAPLGFINALTLPVYQGAPYVVVVWMEFLFGVAFVVLYVMSGKSRFNGAESNLHIDTVADYTVFVSRLSDDVSPTKIAEKFGQWGVVMSVVCLSESLAQMRENTKKQRSVWDRNKHFRLYENMLGKSRGYRFYMKLIHRCTTSGSIQDKLYDMEYKLKELHNESVSAKYTGHAFVTYKSKADVLRCLKHFNQTKLDQCWVRCCTDPNFHDDESILVARASEAEAVIYENFTHGAWGNAFRRLFITPLLSAAILFVTLMAVIAIKLNPYVNDQQLNTSNVYIVKLIGYAENAGLSIFIVLLGELIELVLSVLVKLERHQSKSRLQSVRLSRIFAVQCVNNIAVLFLVTITALIFEPFNTLDQIAHPVVLENFARLNSYGFVSKSGITVVVVTMTSAVIPNLWHASLFIVNYLKRHLYMKSALTQHEMDLAQEGRSFNVTDHYSYLLIMLYYVFLYWALIPIVSIIAFVGVVFRYFIIKYNLMYNHPRPKDHDTRVFKRMVRKIMKFGYIAHVFATLMWFWFNSVSGKHFVDDAGSFDKLFGCTDIWIVLPLVMAFGGFIWLLFSIPPISTIRFALRTKRLNRAASLEAGVTTYTKDLGQYVVVSDIMKEYYTASIHHSQYAEIVLARHLLESNELRSIPTVAVESPPERKAYRSSGSVSPRSGSSAATSPANSAPASLQMDGDPQQASSSSSSPRPGRRQ